LFSSITGSTELEKLFLPVTGSVPAGGRGDPVLETSAFSAGGRGDPDLDTGGVPADGSKVTEGLVSLEDNKLLIGFCMGKPTS